MSDFELCAYGYERDGEISFLGTQCEFLCCFIGDLLPQMHDSTAMQQIII